MEKGVFPDRLIVFVFVRCTRRYRVGPTDRPTDRSTEYQRTLPGGSRIWGRCFVREHMQKKSSGEISPVWNRCLSNAVVSRENVLNEIFYVTSCCVLCGARRGVAHSRARVPRVPMISRLYEPFVVGCTGQGMLRNFGCLAFIFRSPLGCAPGCT